MKNIFRGCLVLVGIGVVGLIALMAVVFTGGEPEWDWTWDDPLADVVWSGSYGDGIEISAEPQSALTSQPVTIQVNGLEPNQMVGIRATATDKNGVVWQSAASYVADAAGLVDLSTSAPDAGLYSGADAMGLFWSLRPITDIDAHHFATDGQHYEVTLTAEADGATLASAVVERWHYSSDVVREPISEDGIVGTLFRPDSAENAPAILVIGGSEGGIPETTAAHWANEGYVALAVGYFGVGQLPEVLSVIPLETFDKALVWLQSHPAVDESRVAVSGYSRGSEAALLTAINHPELAAVVVQVPSSMVWGGLDFEAQQQNRGVLPSAWTHNGSELPANGYSFGIETLRTMAGKPTTIRGMFAGGVEAPTEGSVIPVEQIEAPIHLISATDDQLWPSTTFAEQIESRLAANSFSYAVEHVVLQGAGHGVTPAWEPPVFVFDNTIGGGSREANARASAEFWTSQTDFLEGVFGQ